MTCTALITGITGQDGSYLTELLLDKGYEVHGLVRRSSTMERSRLRHLYADSEVYGQRLFLHYADLDDPTTIRRVVTKVQPTEFYHLAGQSHVGLSFEIPESTCDMTAIGTLRIMEILRDQPQPPRFLHASSREIFGTPAVSPQDEATPISPNSPYGCAKVFATQMAKIYREAHGLFFCNAICYNHESPRRGENFVTRKVTLAAARIKVGQQSSLSLGDLDAARDWGYARDYVNAMWLMLQQDAPDDYVLATGISHTIRELLEAAFTHVGLNWQDYVKIDERFNRPADACQLLGNPAKAEAALGWKRSVDFYQLVQLMVDSDLKRVSNTS
ncbi:MAG: GDP-mannose 4,6-dehydratase [Fuerstiella sp.]|nr:GDP-mannose 4,6-dehydratase [Fuerstiella sp.]MCP4787482.1 GDP-mannose 4,6-dehydratase [Fuerstiella sp.]MCP4859009.1 GDP-mannose 4,6-dehydratase [Fuerstiella sp.]